jgi:hypothetical protein
LRDFDFGPGSGADLVLRSPVRGFTIPRAAQLERYFVRMYDASTPPNYSALSAAIFTDLPVSGVGVAAGFSPRERTTDLRGFSRGSFPNRSNT